MEGLFSQTGPRLTPARDEQFLPYFSGEFLYLAGLNDKRP